MAQGFADEMIVEQGEAVYRLLKAMKIVKITYPVLSRAAQPLPPALGTLDTIHLATALLWKEQAGNDLSMATHDVALAAVP